METWLNALSIVGIVIGGIGVVVAIIVALVSIEEQDMGKKGWAVVTVAGIVCGAIVVLSIIYQQTTSAKEEQLAKEAVQRTYQAEEVRWTAAIKYFGRERSLQKLNSLTSLTTERKLDYSRSTTYGNGFVELVGHENEKRRVSKEYSVRVLMEARNGEFSFKEFPMHKILFKKGSPSIKFRWTERRELATCGKSEAECVDYASEVVLTIPSAEWKAWQIKMPNL